MIEPSDIIFTNFNKFMISMLYTKSDNQREYTPESSPRSSDYRSEYWRDYGRLIHCAAFRRLQNKTQIFPGPESDFFRNRLTHSIEVAQIAKTIAMKLNHENDFFKKYPIDTDIIETISLAHDIGHPPFGHTGEKALHECMQNHGGFEGNAQTLRILSRLEKKCRHIQQQSAAGFGLNLTMRSLAGVLKYDQQIPMRSDRLQKGYYISEASLVDLIKQRVAPMATSHFKTIECQIMDIADYIAYSTYDTEDALKGGFINPLQMISADQQLLKKIQKKLPIDMDLEIQDIKHVIYNIFAPHLLPYLDSLPNDPILLAARLYQQADQLSQDSSLRTELTASLVDEFISNVSVTINHEIPALSSVKLSESAYKKVEILKHYSFEAVIVSRRLKIVAYRGAEIIKTIFNILTDQKIHGDLLLPNDVQQYYKQANNEPERYRVICDFIASMSDNYAIEFYSRLKSGNQQTIFKPF